MAATTVDTLLIKIEADLSSLKRQLAQSQQATSRATGKMRQSFGRMEAAVGSVASRLGTLRGGVIAVGAVLATGLGINIARVNAQFQDLELTLATVFGGMEEGQAAMSFIQTFAQRTPFDIQTLSKAFIQLGGAGIKPTEELLTTFGDAAAATTNRVAAFEAMVRIATRAVGGGLGLEELEQLVSQGIPVYPILQRELGVTRLEISELGQTAEGAAKIMNALQRGLKEDFGGGMQRSSKNLSVSMSNLGIAMTNLRLALGEGISGTGLTGAFTFMSDTLMQMAVIVKPLVHLLGTVLAGAVYAVTLPFRALTETILYLGRTLVEFGRYLGEFKGFGFIGEAAESLSSSLAGLEQAMNKNITGLDTTVTESKEAAEAITDQQFAVAQLQRELAGMEAHYLAANEAVRGMKDVSGEQLIVLTDLIKKEMELKAQLAAKTKAAEDAAEKEKRLAEIVRSLTFENEQLHSANLGVNESTLEYQRILEQFGGDLGEHGEKIRILIEEQHALNAATEAAEAQQEAYNERIKEGKQIAQGFASEQSKLDEQLRKVEDAFYAGAISEDEFRRTSADLGHQLNRLDPMFAATEDAARQAGDAIADSLADAVVDGKLSMDTFQNIFRDFIKTIIAEAIKTFVIRKIMGSIFGGGFAGGGSVGGGGFTDGGSFSGLAGGGRIPARATGGPVLVGERGPELFVPHSAGNIKNNHDTKNLLGGGTPVVVNQNINVSTGVADTVRAEVLGLMPRIKSETVSAVTDAKRRGTGITKVFA